MNNELVQYIENEIFPLYNRNEEGHWINHIRTVIKRSLNIKRYNWTDCTFLWLSLQIYNFSNKKVKKVIIIKEKVL